MVKLTVSRGLELSVTSSVAPSAGNAAGALATYGAAEVTVLVPADVAPASREEVLAMGGRLVLVDRKGHESVTCLPLARKYDFCYQ